MTIYAENIMKELKLLFSNRLAIPYVYSTFPLLNCFSVFLHSTTYLPCHVVSKIIISAK